MTQGNTYRYLQELSKSDYQIVGGEPNIMGWEVKNENGTYIGEVSELLFDPETQAVRYLVIDLKDNGMHLDDKLVMIPIGLAHLHVSDDEVVLPNIHIDQFNALPDYDPDSTGPETEVYIRSIIGSPAALRIEETITEFDQNQFYDHHHFDKGRLYQRGSSTESTEPFATSNETVRSEEEETIAQLIDNSKYQHPTDGSITENGHTVAPPDQANAQDKDLENPATRGI
jgi:hypothetical protein